MELALYSLSASLPGTDKHSSLVAFLRFRRSSGADDSMFHCVGATSTTTAHCAATRVESSNSGSIQPPSTRSGTARGISGNIYLQRKSRSRAHSYKLANAANVEASGNSLLGRLRCRAGWRSNSQPISSNNWRRREQLTTALVSTHRLLIRSGCAWNIGRSRKRSLSECVPGYIFPVTLMSHRSAGVQITTNSSIASSHDGHAGSTCFATNTSSTLKKLSIVETPQLGHATYVFAKPRSMDSFLALSTKITKDDIRRNRNDARRASQLVGRVIHGPESKGVARRNMGSAWGKIPVRADMLKNLDPSLSVIDVTAKMQTST